ncbi:MAG: PaeR7I family type II restriction endonuclease [Xanthomonadaceae bacterium]|nr:PaeR7I family type II restriction endonuclease [Xanthomonadaceae bacterium]MDP2186667.1 PaeR7I family type II restriction endonuclease [Xanthomonadales bacterium]MDZ4114505.1 PaeR7I family type II restriction endonuclease [Xanthomonadaceae bacterium]MDZ4378981.1 PaeR7I family type II restriction endonuclease [Xanthomonadaceae bacterium]
MKPSLLPADFDTRAADAVRQFWQARAPDNVGKQGGARDAVVSGKNMDGFVGLVEHVSGHCGLPASAVYTRKSQLVLPGFFRATKNWDALVIHERRLLAVFEFKSQVGSFGNNFNNRSEEAIGSAADLWVAHHHGAYGDAPRPSRNRVRESSAALLNPSMQSDPRPPFLAWLMLLEECDASLAAVRCDEPHFRVFDEFRSASYAQRYQVLCERLVERQLYSAAALELSVANCASSRALSSATSIRNVFAEFAGRVLAAQT